MCIFYVHYFDLSWKYENLSSSCAGVPIEIVSKVILPHANLATTQRYLGKISDTEAMRWIENLYA